MYRSLAEIADVHGGELRVFARDRTGSASIAEDIVQEAFLKLAHLGAERIRNPRAFLYRVVGNLAIDMRRRQARERQRSVPLTEIAFAVACDADAERSLIARQRLAKLRAVVDGLPPRCRECFILRRFEDVEPDEIASRMGISRNMVEKHLRLAVVQCAQALRQGDI